MAVSLTMVITTLLLVPVMRDIWGLSLPLVIAVTVGFLLVDLPFLGANLSKIPDGGWVPLMVAAVMYLLMTTFHRGSVLVGQQEDAVRQPFEQFWQGLPRDTLAQVEGTAVFLSRDAQATPSALVCNVEHNRVIHRQTIVMTVQSRRTPRVPASEQVEVHALGDGGWHIHAFHGFMQPVRVPRLLRLASSEGLELDVDAVTYFLGRQHPSRPPSPAWPAGESACSR